MNVADLIAALDLPDAARVDQRVPKRLLVEHGAPTAADKRRINDGIEEVYWLAALKPTTVGVPAFRDTVREYLEIAVLRATLRADSKADRLAELTHRAVPYPVLLIAVQGDVISLSLAHKRWSQGEAGAMVLDGDLVGADLSAGLDGALGQGFREALPLARHARTHLFALYQSWMDTVLTLLAARVTGTFASPDSPEHAVARRNALTQCARLDAEIARLRAAAAKERQVARQVEINLTLQRLKEQRDAARQEL